MYTQGTKYALSTEKTQLLSKFMRQTYYRAIRGKYIFSMYWAEAYSRKDIANKSATAYLPNVWRFSIGTY